MRDPPKFAWMSLRPPVVISQLNDDPNAQESRVRAEQREFSLSAAIQDSLTVIKFTATGVPLQGDVNRLAQGHGQPGLLTSFKNNLDFGGTERRSRGDLLAFGIGGTPGTPDFNYPVRRGTQRELQRCATL